MRSPCVHCRRDTEKARKFLAPLEVAPKGSKFDPVAPVQEGQFPEGGFYDEVKRRVNQYFAETKQSSRGGLVPKSLLLLGLYATAWYYGVVQGMTLVCPLVGVLLAVIGLSIQHDANHGAFSPNPVINRIAGFMDDYIGGSALAWRHQHNVAHHADPNDVYLDAVRSDAFFPLLLFTFSSFPSSSSLSSSSSSPWMRANTTTNSTPNHLTHSCLPAFLFFLACSSSSLSVLPQDTYNNYPIIRFNPALPRKWYMKFQHLYALPVYSLLGMSYGIGDMFTVARGRYAHILLHELSTLDLVLFWVGKALHYGSLYVLPLYLHGLAAIWTVILPVQLMGGMFLAACFAVSHNSEGVQYNVDRSVDWGEIQTRTAINWSMLGDPETSWFWGKVWLYVSGGLNYQIEHHLFPGVAHIHYPAISRIVRAVCAERNIPYNAQPSYFQILLSHLRTLRMLGRGEDDAVNHSKPRNLDAPKNVEPADVWARKRIPGEAPAGGAGSGAEAKKSK